MIKDINIRTLPQILAIAKVIIDAGREKEFIQACEGKETYFVVTTDSARQFMATFLGDHKLDPNSAKLQNFRYGEDTCT